MRNKNYPQPRVGLVFPTREIEPSPSAMRAWADMATAAQADYITVSDHILGVDPDQQSSKWANTWPHASKFKRPYNHEDRFHEAFVTLGFLAAICPLELSTGVLVLPQRNTALVAKQAAQVDLLCGGKLRLGVGVGWNQPEFSSVGAEFLDRARRFEEQIELLRHFWTNEVISYQGKYHHVQGAGLAPMPVQRPIPVWIGGAGLGKGIDPVAKLLQRIGRIADGWCLNAAIVPNEVVRDAIDFVKRCAAEHGRDPDHLGFDVRLHVDKSGRDEVAERARKFVEAGGTHLTIETNGLGLSQGPQSMPAIAELVSFVRRAVT